MAGEAATILLDANTRRHTPRLPKPSTRGASLGFSVAKAIRITIGAATALQGWLLALQPSWQPSVEQRAVWQLAALEAILCVPGYTEAASLLVKSTLVGTTSAERCSAALQDAASANMRLTTWLDVLQPSILARLCLLVIQVLAFQLFAVGFMLLPSTTRSIAAYLEFASSKAYAVALQDMDEQGMLSSLGVQRIPWETAVMCDLQAGSTVKEALPLFCSEAEEHSAAYLTAAHTEASWWEAPLQWQTSAPSPTASTAKDREVSFEQLSSPRQPVDSPIPALRPSSFGSIKRMSQLFDSKWAKTPRNTPRTTPTGTLQPDALLADAQLAAAAEQPKPEPVSVMHNGIDMGSSTPSSLQNGHAQADKDNVGVLVSPLSPLAQKYGLDTSPADDDELLIAELSTDADGGQDRLVGQSTGEVYVDAKEVLTPPASLIEEAHDSAQLLDTVNPFSA